MDTNTSKNLQIWHLADEKIYFPENFSLDMDQHNHYCILYPASKTSSTGFFIPQPTEYREQNELFLTVLTLTIQKILRFEQIPSNCIMTYYQYIPGDTPRNLSEEEIEQVEKYYTLFPEDATVKSSGSYMLHIITRKSYVINCSYKKKNKIYEAGENKTINFSEIFKKVISKLYNNNPKYKSVPSKFKGTTIAANIARFFDHMFPLYDVRGRFEKIINSKEATPEEFNTGINSLSKRFNLLNSLVAMEVEIETNKRKDVQYIKKTPDQIIQSANQRKKLYINSENRLEFKRRKDFLAIGPSEFNFTNITKRIDPDCQKYSLNIYLKIGSVFSATLSASEFRKINLSQIQSSSQSNFIQSSNAPMIFENLQNNGDDTDFPINREEINMQQPEQSEAPEVLEDGLYKTSVKTQPFFVSDPIQKEIKIWQLKIDEFYGKIIGQTPSAQFAKTCSLVVECFKSTNHYKSMTLEEAERADKELYKELSLMFYDLVESEHNCKYINAILTKTMSFINMSKESSEGNGVPFSDLLLDDQNEISELDHLSPFGKFAAKFSLLLDTCYKVYENHSVVLLCMIGVFTVYNLSSEMSLNILLSGMGQTGKSNILDIVRNLLISGTILLAAHTSEKSEFHKGPGEIKSVHVNEMGEAFKKNTGIIKNLLTESSVTFRRLVSHPTMGIVLEECTKFLKLQMCVCTNEPLYEIDPALLTRMFILDIAKSGRRLEMTLSDAKNAFDKIDDPEIIQTTKDFSEFCKFLQCCVYLTFEFIAARLLTPMTTNNYDTIMESLKNTKDKEFKDISVRLSSNIARINSICVIIKAVLQVFYIEKNQFNIDNLILLNPHLCDTVETVMFSLGMVKMFEDKSGSVISSIAKKYMDTPNDSDDLLEKCFGRYKKESTEDVDDKTDGNTSIRNNSTPIIHPKNVITGSQTDRSTTGNGRHSIGKVINPQASPKKLKYNLNYISFKMSYPDFYNYFSNQVVCTTRTIYTPSACYTVNIKGEQISKDQCKSYFNKIKTQKIECHSVLAGEVEHGIPCLFFKETGSCVDGYKYFLLSEWENANYLDMEYANKNTVLFKGDHYVKVKIEERCVRNGQHQRSFDLISHEQDFRTIYLHRSLCDPSQYRNKSPVNPRNYISTESSFIIEQYGVPHSVLIMCEILDKAIVNKGTVAKHINTGIDCSYAGFPQVYFVLYVKPSDRQISIGVKKVATNPSIRSLVVRKKYRSQVNISDNSQPNTVEQYMTSLNKGSETTILQDSDTDILCQKNRLGLLRYVNTQKSTEEMYMPSIVACYMRNDPNHQKNILDTRDQQIPGISGIDRYTFTCLDAEDANQIVPTFSVYPDSICDSVLIIYKQQSVVGDLSVKNYAPGDKGLLYQLFDMYRCYLEQEKDSQTSNGIFSLFDEMMEGTEDYDIKNVFLEFLDKKGCVNTKSRLAKISSSVIRQKFITFADKVKEKIKLEMDISFFQKKNAIKMKSCIETSSQIYTSMESYIKKYLPKRNNGEDYNPTSLTCVSMYFAVHQSINFNCNITSGDIFKKVSQKRVDMVKKEIILLANLGQFKDFIDQSELKSYIKKLEKSKEGDSVEKDIQVLLKSVCKAISTLAHKKGGVDKNVYKQKRSEGEGEDEDIEEDMEEEVEEEILFEELDKEQTKHSLKSKKSKKRKLEEENVGDIEYEDQRKNYINNTGNPKNKRAYFDDNSEDTRVYEKEKTKKINDQKGKEDKSDEEPNKLSKYQVRNNIFSQVNDDLDRLEVSSEKEFSIKNKTNR